MAVAKNQVVNLNYTLHSIENGEKVFIESTESAEPLTFLYGAGMMLPKFEEHIEGLNVGDKKSFELAPEDAYGEKDERAIAQLPAEMFAEAGIPPVGEVIPLQDNEGNQFRAVVVEVSPEVVVADLNHPMAGKTLHFDIEIIEVRPATEEELDHGHSHGPNGTDTH